MIVINNRDFNIDQNNRDYDFGHNRAALDNNTKDYLNFKALHVVRNAMVGV